MLGLQVCTPHQAQHERLMKLSLLSFTLLERELLCETVPFDRLQKADVGIYEVIL